jgi:hypothetical protein
MIESVVQGILAEGRPVITYCHPYEFDPREMSAYRDSVSWLYRAYQSMGRRGYPHRMQRLFARFPFGRLDAVLDGLRLS